jgi:hypothetical protein
MSKPALGRSAKTASLLATLSALLACAAISPASSFAFDRSFLGQFNTVTTIGSTKPMLGKGVPGNEDVNPYGIVVVPTSVGTLVRNDVLISNFNNAENHQGTGSTLVEVSPTGHLSVFAQISAASLPGACPGGVGLTTALAILPGGFVVVGSLPAENGEAVNAKPGCLIVLNSSGKVVKTISGGPINGPWDMTAVSAGPLTALFVTNVLNGTVENGETPTEGGTVVRIGLVTLPGQPPTVISEKVIASGFPERTSEEALVVGPTGVGLGFEGTLYVADTQDNRIAAVPNALFRSGPGGLPAGAITVAKGGFLNGPLGLTIAPNGDIVSANGDDGNIVETTPFGAEFQPFETEAGGGGLFGLAVAPNQRGIYFVNDLENTLQLLH